LELSYGKTAEWPAGLPLAGRRQALTENKRGPDNMLKKVPNPIDRHVGSRVRMRRMLAGVSQEKLGEALGLTFQQVQKYEKGTNRISASRLQQISKMLGVPVAFFFDGAPTDEITGNGFAEASGTTYVADFLATSEGVQLTKAFVRIKSPRVRRRIVDLVESLGDSPIETIEQ
jgi:transcriptional regulator with XRE-family HTH domain